MAIRFGTCILDPARHELWRDGEVVPVEPQVFDLLQLMVERAGELVTHDDLSRVVWHGRIVSDGTVSARISAARTAIGDSGAEQRLIRTVPRRGFRFVGEVEREETPAGRSAAQGVRYCVARDGVHLAWAQTGRGPPLVRAGHWLTHLERDWESPVWRPVLDAMGAHFSVLRYDQRGTGMSEGSVEGMSLADFTDDLEAVVDAARLDRFVLYGTSQGCPIAVDYAIRHPDRVSHLVLHGGYATGRLKRADPSERAEGEALLTLVRTGWGREGSPYLRMFAALFLPDGTPGQIASLADMQKHSATPETAAALRRAVDEFDVSGRLSEVTVPTLVLHGRNDGVHPLSQGRILAAGIRDARFVELDTANHVVLPQDPAWPRLLAAVLDFCKP